MPTTIKGTIVTKFPKVKELPTCVHSLYQLRMPNNESFLDNDWIRCNIIRLQTIGVKGLDYP